MIRTVPPTQADVAVALRATRSLARAMRICCDECKDDQLGETSVERASQYEELVQTLGGLADDGEKAVRFLEHMARNARNASDVRERTDVALAEINRPAENA